MPTIVYQTGVNGDIRDATLDEELPDTNDGTGISVILGLFIGKSPLAKRGVFAFTMDLPPGAVITKATFRLDWTDTVVGGVVYELHRILDDLAFRPFGETTVTWNERGLGTNWVAAGGDVETPPLATTFTAPDTPSKQDIDVLAFTRDAYNNRNQTWFLHIRRQNEATNQDVKKVTSSEGAIIADRPKLTVTYNQSGGGYMAMSYYGLVEPPSGW